MDVVVTAAAALDAHRGIVVLARIGVAFLMNLAVAPENKVIP
jgi:hypothetical protein